MKARGWRLEIGAWRFVLIVGALLMLAGVVLAQTPEQHDLSWHVVSGGGQDSTSAASGWQVRGTLGQLAIGPAAAAGGHRVGSGYWYGASRAGPEPPELRVYLPLVLRNAQP